MPINQNNAEAIVKEISSLLKQPVNVMDANGVILASTDPSRLGSLHAGAAHVIADGLDELSVETDGQYEGSLAGINLPILSEGQIAGVIGLTGPYETVHVYGQIIKKMTEILLRQYDVHEQGRMSARIQAHFLNEWIFGNSSAADHNFSERGLRLGIDISLSRRILVFCVCNLPTYSANAEGQRILERVRECVNEEILERSGLLLNIAARMFCMIPTCSDSSALKLDQCIRNRVQQTCGLPLASGISSAITDENLRRMHTIYSQAEKALSASLLSIDKKLFCYDDLGMELVLGEISPSAKTEYLRRIFPGCTNEISNWILLLQAYYNSNGSIEKAASQLFLHKNTLQYRLRRLGEITGYDPRQFSNAARYELAIRFYLENRDYWDHSI